MTLFGVLTNELCIGRYVNNQKTTKLQSRPFRNPERVGTTILPRIISLRILDQARKRLDERRPKPLPREAMVEGLRDLWVEKGRYRETS
ncbi:hypothetical protein [Mesorhizobium sp. M0488]|uniref:hypothetical protein n=1 Tax=unclassified Mesorhizobium TaxID=325217 RepID=UPI00333DE11E